VGVSSDTVRYYEKHGLLPTAPRSTCGYRIFPRESLNRIRVIRHALAIGLTVRDLSGIFRERDRGGAPCLRVRRLAGEKLVALEAAIRELRSSRQELLAAILEWDRLLAKTPKGKPARLLESHAARQLKKRTWRSRVKGVARGTQKKEKNRWEKGSSQ
jgi:MerR family transcriptional regulator, copper efflux regulator